MFEAERAAILSLRDEGKIGAEVMRRIERHTDPEELRFQRLKEVTMSQIRAVLVEESPRKPDSRRDREAVTRPFGGAGTGLVDLAEPRRGAPRPGG
jgi:hypothetical protein